MKTFTGAIFAISMFSATSAGADNNLVEGIVGVIIGQAIVEQSKATHRHSSSGMSAETRSKNINIQEALTYFGFPVGTADGVLGRKSRDAISQFQACIGKSISGELDFQQEQFLLDSHFKAQQGGALTLQLAASKPNGMCGLLQQYLQDLLAPPVPASPAIAAPVAQQQSVVQHQSVVQQQSVVVNNNQTTNTTVIMDPDLITKYDLLLNQVKLLDQIDAFVRSKQVDEVSYRKLASVQAKLAELHGLVTSVETEAQGKYGTPIRPTNANLGVTAAKASEVFPRVPYYVPGTDETGALWIKPFVTDSGMLMYDFNFVTAHSDFDKIRETIELTSGNIRLVAAALVKIAGWNDTAMSNSVRRYFEKSAFCFPLDMCGKVEEGNNSNEVLFVIYEDGSTAVRLQKNKGKFRSAFNLSIESGLLLSAYMDYMAEIGEKEFATNTMTNSDLNAIFQ